jgi:DNA-binding transcriptional MerR regulator
MPTPPQVATLRFTLVAAGNHVGAVWATNIALMPSAVWIEPAPAPGAPRGRAGRIVLPLGELAHESGVTLRTLRFYQSKGLLAPQHNGRATEIREILAARVHGCTKPINRTKCVDQIKMLERQRRDIDRALAELRQIYADTFIVSDVRPAAHPDRSELLHRSTRSHHLKTRVKPAPS